MARNDMIETVEEADELSAEMAGLSDDDYWDVIENYKEYKQIFVPLFKKLKEKNSKE